MPMILGGFPPTGLVLLSIVSVQVGAGLAINLFPILGAEGTVAVRIVISALLLALTVRKRTRALSQMFIQNWKLLLVFGFCIAIMNLFFYQALARIPLGATVALEFIGPLSVAAFTSRKLSHFAWIALAALGIFLLSPLSGVDLDSLGIIFALLAGVGWGLFIIFAKRVGDRIPGNDGIVIAMVIAALTMLPFAAPVATVLISNPLILLTALAVALLSTTIPFTFEFHALRRMPSRNYSILVSVEPAVAAIIGALLLGERIGLQGVIAVACVVIAAIGISLTGSADKPDTAV
ncbi:MAG: inner membrane transporter RhtA [Parasphingorhabdus sp.]|jgi:inner membrane transporter RhtA